MVSTGLYLKNSSTLILSISYWLNGGLNFCKLFGIIKLVSLTLAPPKLGGKPWLAVPHFLAIYTCFSQSIVSISVKKKKKYFHQV